jgi:son of sevenless-like protein
MVAIVLGLTATPICRLKQSWKLVNAQLLGKLVACEAMIDPHRNFINYRNILEAVTSPCVPYIGMFMHTGFSCETIVDCHFFVA